MSQFSGMGQVPVRRSPLVAVVIVGAVVMALLLAISVVSVAGYFGMRAKANSEWERADGLAQRTTAPAAADPAPVLAAGRKDVEAAFTYDWAHLEQFAANVQEVSTPAFVDKFTPSVAAIKQQLAQRPSAGGKVSDLAVRELSGDTAELLVFADVTTRAAARPAAVNKIRLRVELKRQGDRWLLNDLTAV
ncbi:hypothetical protein ACFV9C_13780 [Kribbella sp. NPDC059898]|uniref:hypothetical protein n=1 Tax=Kribbella sp. NPDC059898 TaxID=3346995 RepID=UPI003669AE4D